MSIMKLGYVEDRQLVIENKVNSEYRIKSSMDKEEIKESLFKKYIMKKIEKKKGSFSKDISKKNKELDDLLNNSSDFSTLLFQSISDLKDELSKLKIQNIKIGRDILDKKKELKPIIQKFKFIEKIFFSNLLNQENMLNKNFVIKLSESIEGKNIFRDLREIQVILNKIKNLKDLNLDFLRVNRNFISSKLENILSNLELKNCISHIKDKVEKKDSNKKESSKLNQVDLSDNLNRMLPTLKNKVIVKKEFLNDFNSRIKKRISFGEIRSLKKDKKNRNKSMNDININEKNMLSNYSNFSNLTSQIHTGNKNLGMNVFNLKENFISLGGNLNNQDVNLVGMNIFEQIVKKIEYGLSLNGKDFRNVDINVQLKPDYLGKSSFRIQSDIENSLKGIFFVESADLKKVLENQIPYLKEKLLDIGLMDVEDIHVALYEDKGNSKESSFKFQKKTEDYSAYMKNSFEKLKDEALESFLYETYNVNVIV